MQDVILDEIVARAKGKHVVVDVIFNKDDPQKKGYVQYDAFINVLSRDL